MSMSYKPVLKIQRSPLQRFLDFLALTALCFYWVTVINVYPTLPEFIPTHFGLDGVPDTYGPRIRIFLLPIISTALVVLMTILSFQPHLFNYAVPIHARNANKQYQLAITFLLITQFIIILLFILIDIHTISVAFNRDSPINEFCIPALILVLFMPSLLHYFRSRKIK